MKIINEIQGSDGWHKERQMFNRRTASEANAMMGVSSHCSRTDLIKMKKLDAQQEISEYTHKFVFDKGHVSEKSARAISEVEINEDLYPITGTKEIDGLNLLASFDGINIDSTIIEEHKQWNDALAYIVEQDGIVPDSHKWQLVQQQIVSECYKTRFVISNGTEVKRVMCIFQSTKEDREKLIAGWKLFNEDVEKFVLEQEYIPAEPEPIQNLPALSISIKGNITQSNLKTYKTTALEFISNIRTNLETDQDFVDAEKVIKFCDKSEKEIILVKKQALSQTVDIEKLFNELDHLKEEMKVKRLMLEKLVKSRKEFIKNQLILEAKTELDNYVQSLIKNTQEVKNIEYHCALGESIKGKRSLINIKDAINSAVMMTKIDINREFSAMSNNIKYFNDKSENYRFLFNDINTLIKKQEDDFILICNARISEHKENERVRLESERERIAEQERKKIKKTELERIRKEQQIILEREIEEKKIIDAEKQLILAEKYRLKCKREKIVKQKNVIKPEPLKESVTNDNKLINDINEQLNNALYSLEQAQEVVIGYDDKKYSYVISEINLIVDSINDIYSKVSKESKESKESK